MDYVSRVVLNINGQEVDDFKSVSEGELELRKKVKLMGKTGFQKVTPEYGVEVEYVVPESAPEFDFEDIEDGTLTLEFENGRRTTYTGVATLKIGQTKYDGENEATRTVDLGATGRTKK